MKTYSVVQQTPVLFNGGAGGGPGEIGFPNLPSPATPALVDFTLAANQTIVGAWYTPTDNIGALMSFATITVDGSGNQVTITAHGYQGAVGRVRVQLYALVETTV